MTNKRTTRHALLTSLLSLLLCVSMLVGTTFAWFTDSVVSGNNKIIAGNLDVEVYYGDPANKNSIQNVDKLFDDVKLWEPGAMAWEQLTIVNEGTLALKYNMTVNFSNATDNGKGKTLADILQVAIMNEEPTRENIKTAELTYLKNFDLGRENVPMQPGASEGFYMAIYWAPSAIDNEFNMNNGNRGKELSIDLGINLVATQLTSENDSFDNQYDAIAPFSVWDGVVPAEMPETLVVDGANATVHVKDAAAFAYLSKLSAAWVSLYTDGNGRAYSNYANGAGGNYYYSGNWSVQLEADIDLDNHEIEPVQIFFGEGTGATAFNGNNHVIRNINTSTGLFADSTRANYANLTLENVKATKGALTGVSNSSITNVTVKNAAISGTDYVGGLTGRAFGNVTECEVIDSTVFATGKEAGGLIGYAETNHNEIAITYNTVKNVTVYAGNRAAGLVAQPNVNIKVFGNTVDTVTVGAADTSTYNAGAVVSNALAPENVYENTVINAKVSNKAASVSDNNGLKDAIAGDVDTVFVGSGSYALPSLGGKEGVTIEGAADGSTKVNGVNSFNFGEDTTVKNVTFTSDGAHSVRYATTSGDVVYDNCVFEGRQYGYHVDNANGGTITFNNCTFYGRNALAGSGTYVFNNCTFKYTYSNYNTTNIYSVATFNNCTWDSKLELAIAAGAKAIVDGEEITQRVVFISDARAMESFQFKVNGGTSYAGMTVMLSADIDMKDGYYSVWYPVGQTGGTQFQGTFDGHGYTIKNLNIDSSKQTGEYYSSGLFGWLNHATVKNLTIENATVIGNHNVGVIAGYMETSGCTISNCHVVNATVVAKHANNDACGDKVGVIVGHAGNSGVKVENCSAKDCTVTAGRDAGQIVGAALTANVTGCTAENVTVTDGGDCTHGSAGTNIRNEIIGRVLG